MDKTSSTALKRGPRSILVVGYKTRSLLVLSLLLQRFGYDVSISNTSAQAIERASATPPALVITDLDLLGTSGLDLFQDLHRNPQTSSIPVILMIYPSDAGLIMRHREQGVAACIMKPVQADELYRAVQAAIEPRPRASIRIDTRLPVTVNNVPVDCSGDECEVGLSLHGMYVPLNANYPRDSRLEIRMNIKDRTISTECAVLYCATTDSNPCRRPGIGLKFVMIAPQDQEFIGKFIRDEVMLDITAALSRGRPIPGNAG